MPGHPTETQPPPALVCLSEDEQALAREQSLRREERATRVDARSAVSAGSPPAIQVATSGLRLYARWPDESGSLHSTLASWRLPIHRKRQADTKYLTKSIKYATIWPAILGRVPNRRGYPVGTG